MAVPMHPLQCKVHWNLNQKGQLKELANLLNKPGLSEQQIGRLSTFLTVPRQVCNAVMQNGTPVAPKLEAIAAAVAADTRAGKKSVVFSFFLDRGVHIISALLDRHGVRHAVVTGKESAAKKAAHIASYNTDRLPVLVFSKAISEGIDLKHTSTVHVAEPQFNLSAVQQVVGRAVRQNSHTDPKVPKHVVVYHWVSQFPAGYTEPGRAWRTMSADSIVDGISQKKGEKLTAFMKAVLKWETDAQYKITRFCESPGQRRPPGPQEAPSRGQQHRQRPPSPSPGPGPGPDPSPTKERAHRALLLREFKKVDPSLTALPAGEAVAKKLKFKWLLKHHPNKANNKAAATAATQALNEAYDAVFGV